MQKQSTTILRLAALCAMAILTLAVAVSSVSAQGSGRERSLNQISRDNPNGNYNPTYNPNQIALLRWYQVNTGPTTFFVPATSTDTFGIAFDGTNMWVASYSTGKLNEFSINGQLLSGTITLGGSPYGLAYDGSSIWVANNGSGILQKVNVANRTVTPVSVTGLSSPYFLAFDGSHIWVTDPGSNAVFAVSINFPYAATKFPVGLAPTGIAFDGDCMWVTNTNDGTVWTVPDPYGFNCQINGGVAGPVNWHASSGAQPYDIAYDGINMWASVRFANQVVELDDSLNPGHLLNTINVGTQPQAIAFDGAYIWVGNRGSGSVTKMTASNNPNGAAGTVVGTYSLQHNPFRFAFDGANMWVTFSGVFVGKM